MRLGELIVIARECRKWSQRELERRTGISNALISQIETGHVKDPGFKTVIRLCDELGIKLERAADTVRPLDMTFILRRPIDPKAIKRRRPSHA